MERKTGSTFPHDALERQRRLLALEAIARLDHAADHHLGIDAAIEMAVGAHQALRDLQVADAGGRVHVGGGAALDALGDLQA